MKLRKLIALTLAICLLSGFMILPGSAATAQNQDTRWNIMLVVDGSGSLNSGPNPSDKDGLRYEALSMLIDSLQGTGNYVGAVVFNANSSRDTSWEAMYRGISLDTGLRPINSVSDKEWLKREIKNAKFSGNSGGDTDIGTAMLVAQQHLSNTDNGLKNAIFLFSDGDIDLDYRETMDKSYEHLEQACENIRNDGIKVCGVYLNCNNSNSGEVRNIVYDCMAPDGDLSELFLEINDSGDTTNATDTFTRFLGYSMGPEIDIRERQYIRIPGVGVEEANIRIRTGNGENLPKNLEVIITRPDGTQVSENELSAICSQGRTYQIYKFSNPDCGLWTVEVKIPPDTNIDIKYAPILSINVDAGMEVTPPSASLHVNDTAVVTAFLVKDGNQLSDAASYREYTCYLNMTNAETGKPLPQQEILPDPANPGLYTISIPLTEYAKYDVSVSFICDEVNVVSAQERWDTYNEGPTCNNSAGYQGKCGLFQENVKTLDLSDSKYGISDREDPLSDLTLTITGGDLDPSAFSFNGTDLTFDSKATGSGSIVLTIADTQGETCQMTLYITIKDVTLSYILLLITAFLILMIAVIVIVRTRNSVRTSGSCTITISVPVGDTGDVRNISCTHLTPPGGTNSKRKQNLNAMLERDLQDTIASTAKTNCDRARIPFDLYKETVGQISGELTKATVSSVFYKDKKTKKTCCNRIQFKYGKSSILLNSGDSTSVMMNQIRVTFLYSSSNVVVEDDPFNNGMPAGTAGNMTDPSDFGGFGSGSFGGFDKPQNDPFGGNSGSFGGFDQPQNDSFGGNSGGFGGFDQPQNDSFGGNSGGFGGFDQPKNDAFGGNSGFNQPQNDPFAGNSGGFGNAGSDSADSGWGGNFDDVSFDL